MNIIIKNNITYKYESYWRKSADSKLKDSEGHLFPFPKEGDLWSEKTQFIGKLAKVHDYLKHSNKIKKLKHPRQCLICGKQNVTEFICKLNKTIWENGLIHYINEHNIKPSESFIEQIYKFLPYRRKNERTIKFESTSYTVNDLEYIKFTRNQLLILDALLYHGGKTKKYADSNNKNIFRYSEHAGLIDFNKYGVDKILISGKTSRVDEGDNDIYLPKNIKDAYDYEYIFHTHPPTPKPGGRAVDGILYEFPSISDIFHFIDHFNSGKTQGSLVLAAEGLYNIRKLTFDKKKIKIDEDDFFDTMKQKFNNVQKNSLREYSSNFDTNFFYSVIAQNRKYIDDVNSKLNNYQLNIDYYPRVKDSKNKWVIDTIHLPVFVIEPK
jgi:hypothetical protein